eukprot:2820816-Pyramimonas_sp.AAC.1
MAEAAAPCVRRRGDLVVAREAAIQAAKRRRDTREEEARFRARLLVPREMVKDTLRAGSFVEVPPLVDRFMDCIKLCRARGVLDDYEDEAAVAVGELLFTDAGVDLAFASERARSAWSGVGRNVAHQVGPALAAATWLGDRGRRRILARVAATCRGVEALQFVDSVGYDETPLKIRGNSDRVRRVVDSTVALPESILSLLPMNRGALPTKLFQTQQQFAMLVARRLPCGTKQYVIVTGTTACHVQALSRNTPGSIMQALKETSPMSLPEVRFKAFSRIASVDRHPSNLVVERRIARRM